MYGALGSAFGFPAGGVEALGRERLAGGFKRCAI